MDCPRAELYILDQLRQHLSPTLFYHGLHHTLDVAAQAQSLAEAEGVTDPTDLALLRTAALYHDAGFLTAYQGHEEASCALARQVLPGFGYAAVQVELICQLILATKMPQSPGALLLAQLLCDADLDYLGRPDFWPISRTLFRELQARQLITDEHAWNQIQVQFLSSHRYWTRTATARREAAKQERLAEARALVDGFPGLKPWATQGPVPPAD
ncbi:HD domain-containing protein [Hymenobacter weizhouensis]|uniref:HD domain-containing protein n=1 Tax=Hymenobacter sp. YIM 151500-1 TaxID=2987689 RepID=UPI002226034E|nr:HD domain-containing protein [Hymenobacter sp. YIM 151500-1]UYZ63806.1 HD domain-containing protein [Hymenobacter sp. YIM 151500-1]